jgi:AraC-like DNA-binding protein
MIRAGGEAPLPPKECETLFLRLSSADLPERDRIEAFREIFGRTILKIEMDPLEQQSLDVDMTLRGLDGFGMASGRLSPMRNWHTAGLADNDDLVLVALEAGRGVVEQCGREATIHGGEAVLTANGEPGIFTGHSETSLINFRLNRTLLASRVQDVDAALARAIPRETATLRLLVNYSGVLIDGDALATPELRRAVVDHMHDLAALTLGGTRDAREIAGRRGVRAARLRAIKGDIRGAVGSRDLSVSAVAQRHGVSPRYVQMLFEREGTTFSEFVLAKRLSRAHRMLIDPRYLHIRVSEIAYSAGFSDLSYFNRTFRLRFGMTPSDARGAK